MSWMELPPGSQYSYRHVEVPWVFATPPVGPGWYHLICEACGAMETVPDPDAFALTHTNHHRDGRSGLGDVVHGLASLLGLAEKPCTPCEQRRIEMNGWF